MTNIIKLGTQFCQLICTKIKYTGYLIGNNSNNYNTIIVKVVRQFRKPALGAGFQICQTIFHMTF